MLSLPEIKNITFGALSVTSINGEFQFERFEGSAKERYVRVGRSTASVVLDFYTDSKNLSFDYHAVKIIDRNHCFFDVYENDVLIAHLGKMLEEGEQEFSGSYSASLSDGRKRIRIYLPNLHEGRISSVCLSDGAYIEPPCNRGTLLMMGDSITHGYDAYFPSLSYANTVIRELDLAGINQAIGGEMFREENLPDKSSFTPDVITVAYGTNDWSWSNKTREECAQNAKRYFSKLRRLYPDARLFYISPLYRGDNGRITTVGDFDGAVKEFSSVAEEFGAEVIDGVKLIPHTPEVFEDKYLHPNDLGFTQYAKALLSELEKRGLKK